MADCRSEHTWEALDLRRAPKHGRQLRVSAADVLPPTFNRD
jgi:hypothetical protein